MNSELVIRYDPDLRPISAQCTSCGQKMPSLPSDLDDTAARIIWFSDHFIEHKKRKHPAAPYRAHDQQQATDSQWRCVAGESPSVGKLRV